MKLRFIPFALVIAGFLNINTAQAQVPAELSYQGFLLDNTDTPIDGTANLVIRLFDAASSGTQVWTRTYSSHPVDDGVYNIILSGGSPTLGSVDFDEALWLEVVANGQTVSPRTKLTSTPYSFVAQGLELPYTASAAVGTQFTTDGIINVENTGDGAGFVVTGAGGDGLFVQSAGQPSGQGITTTASNGVEIQAAEGSGVHISRVDRKGVFVDIAGEHGFFVARASSDGVYVGNASENGIRVNTALHSVLSGTSNGMEPALDLDQTGSGKLVDLKKDGSTIFQISNSGQK